MPDEKTLIVNDPRRKPYRRVIRMRPVTFTCEDCGLEVTEDVYPGPTPIWCDRCRREARRKKDRERQREHRAK